MKSILRKIVFYSVALFLTAQILEGVKISGGLPMYIVGGIVLSILFVLVKPILSIITLPLNIITLGLFSFLTNAIILYLLTVFVPNISIGAFRSSGFSFLGFVVPSISVNNFFAYIIASVFISFIVGFFKMVNKKIVCLGGGTGTSVALSGFKKYSVDLSAIVSMADDGGANRVIRDEFGLLPTSDIRQCFVALAENTSDSEQSLRKLFTYRFHKGHGFGGMTFGNLFMVALTDIFGSQTEAIKKTSEILKIKGRILPITLTDSKLVAIYENGERIVGEHLIDEPRHDGKLKIAKLFEPPSKAYPEAVKTILDSDIVVLGPGDLYTSLISGLAVRGISEALNATKAKVVYVLNLMTRYGQTSGFTAKNHIEVLEEYIGKNCLDYVLINSGSIPQGALKKYEEAKEFKVEDDLKDNNFKIIRSDILSRREIKKLQDILKEVLSATTPISLQKQ